MYSEYIAAIATYEHGSLEPQFYNGGPQMSMAELVSPKIPCGPTNPEKLCAMWKTRY